MLPTETLVLALEQQDTVDPQEMERRDLRNQLDRFLAGGVKETIGELIHNWTSLDNNRQKMDQVIKTTFRWKPKLDARSTLNFEQIKEEVRDFAVAARSDESQYLTKDSLSLTSFILDAVRCEWDDDDQMVVILEMTDYIAGSLYKAIACLKNRKIELPLRTVPQSRAEKDALNHRLRVALQSKGRLKIFTDNNRIISNTLTIPLTYSNICDSQDAYGDALSLSQQLDKLEL